MTPEPGSPTDSEVSDEAVRGMVAALEPAWSVESIERSPHGTDFVATLDVRTPDGPRTVVLKATTADLVDPPIARSEPRLFELVGRETTIPVPEVFGYRDAHDDFPAPFYLVEHVDGVNLEDDPESLSPPARERVVRDAGRNLVELHELGPLPAVGSVGVARGELTVLDTDDHPRADDFRERLLADAERTLDVLTEGGYFPDLADDPERFADLVEPVRERLRDAIPELSEPDPPTYNHWDYRYGNLLLDPETGETNAVLDWANLSSADPAYNLAKVEFSLLKPVRDDPERTAELRETFRSAYAEGRESWAFDEPTLERMAVYRLTDRLDAMACLPLWYEDATPAERDERAAEHRTFLAERVPGVDS
ncbi:phosphotransferase [Halosimplex rubrum]|uniref:Phosphotransferase n=1 Tax=Halosimplex rubrum TaxID=869889 RepID=A0A7D5TJA7_9EURY|nr:phosphotransferase [Halosimplex rubrum]QLH75912.1 phosphotransferase [Halosimplex rubrum]